MRRLIKIAVGLAVLGGLAFGGTALATGGGDSATGPRRRPGSGGGARAPRRRTANSVERDSENGATWEVEVTKTDGTTVDVRLDASYQVVVVDGDSEEGGKPDDDSVQDESAGGDAGDPSRSGGARRRERSPRGRRAGWARRRARRRERRPRVRGAGVASSPLARTPRRGSAQTEPRLVRPWERRSDRPRRTRANQRSGRGALHEAQAVTTFQLACSKPG